MIEVVTLEVLAAHLPGDASIWLFVIGDMLIFSAYFAAYLFDRGHNHGLFLQSQQHLSQGLGVINWPQSSFMIRQMQWAGYGAALAALGLILIWQSKR